VHPNAQPLEEAQRQLSLMLQQQEELAPALYRDLALYLQVLREGLLPAVQQACFHLATQVVPERYAQLPQERRLQFQQRLASLVQRCCALLTVEQLMGLASQQLQREHRRRARQRQHLLQAFLEGRDPEADAAPAERPEAEAGASQPSMAPPPAGRDSPQGSVHLGLDLPLSADLFDRGIPGLPRSSDSGQPPAAPAAPADLDPSVASGDGPQGTGNDTPPETPASAASGSGPAAAAASATAAQSSDLQLLQSLFQMAAEGLGQELPSPAEASRESGGVRQAPAAGESPGEPTGDGPSLNGPMALSVAARIEPLPPPDPAITGSSLPRDPLRQLAWWRQLDRALSRRLRNLSHALNVEMMRLGLAQGLLPLNLLDAVLEGQVEALPAPANLLRLPLPLPSLNGGSTSTDVLALLLRPSDLEYEQLRLRTCRKRLEQRRRALRTMAKRYRIWQRRVMALEAEQQWFRDSAQLQSRPLPPSPG